MTRRARIRPASIAPALLLLLLLAAGCGDARLGGPEGVSTPGDNPVPNARPTNPSSPVIGGAAGEGATPAK